MTAPITLYYCILSNTLIQNKLLHNHYFITTYIKSVSMFHFTVTVSVAVSRPLHKCREMLVTTICKKVLSYLKNPMSSCSHKNLKVLFTSGALTCADCVGQLLLRLLQCVDCCPPGCASSPSCVTSYLNGSVLPGIGSGGAPLR